jgi:hypothetical protein
MEQSLGHGLIMNAVLIVVMMTVLGWVESRGRRGGPVQRRDPGMTSCPHQHFGQRPARYRGRPAPGRKTA